MKINQIISETTTAGSVAPVSQSFVKMSSRNPVVSSKKGNNLLTGTKTKKKYMNSLGEGKGDKEDPPFDADPKKSGPRKDQFGNPIKHVAKHLAKKGMKQTSEPKKVEEAKLDEDDIIVVPGRGSKRKSGFIPHGQSRVDHEVEMARSDVLATMKNAEAIYKLLKHKTEEEGIEGWVQEKLIKANDYLNAVKEYYDEKMLQQENVPPGGTIAGGGFEESAVNEKAVSKAQQRFMGMAHAIQKGKKIPGASKELKSVAKGMTKKAAHDFAATKHKGLPEKVKKKD